MKNMKTCKSFSVVWRNSSRGGFPVSLFGPQDSVFGTCPLLCSSAELGLSRRAKGLMVSLTTPNARLTWKTTNHESTQQIVFINCNLLITRKHDYKQESELETKQHSHLFSLPTELEHTHIYSNIQPIARTNKKSSTNQRTATKSPQPPYKE